MNHNAEFIHPDEGPTAADAELAFLRQQVMLLNDRLKEVEKHKSSFLSNMRNEIINPFSSILGLSGNLLREEQTDPKQLHKIISLIYQETFELDFHLKTIFLAAEIESGECYPQPAFMRPEGVIAETLATLDHLFKKMNLQLVVYQSFEEDVWGDSEKIQMIFLGVLYNILRKSKPGDGISVKAYTRDETLYAEMYNVSKVGEEWSLFDHSHFQELCMFNEDIQEIHLSVAKSLTETLNGKLEAGSYSGEIAAFRFSIPVAGFCEGKDIYEDKGLIFQ